MKALWAEPVSSFIQALNLAEEGQGPIPAPEVALQALAELYTCTGTEAVMAAARLTRRYQRLLGATNPGGITSYDNFSP